MKKRKLKNTVFACLTFLILFSCEDSGTNHHSDQPPNIVFIFTDDQRYNTISGLGNDAIITPNYDRIVNNGTSFSHAYNMGSWSGAVCAASRAMIISGRTVWRANNFRQSWKAKDSSALQMSWPKLMESKGYDTYMTGKWHVDASANDLFQNVVHVRPGMPRDLWNDGKRMQKFDQIDERDYSQTAALMPIGYNRPHENIEDAWSPTDTSFGGFWEGGKHWSEVLKDDAISFIEQASKKDNPFFMYLAFNAPHDPRQAPQEFIDLYPIEEIEIPKSYLPEYPFKDDIGNSPRLRDEALAPFPRTEYAIKKHIQEYYAIISHLDIQIGKILDALEESGKLDNTYVFLTADHGLAVGNHGLLGKQNMYDHSIRPPLLIMGPEIPKKVELHADVYLQDIMATSLDLAEIQKPEYVEFNSFLDIAKGNQINSNYESIYGAYLNVQRMIRKDNFKLIIYPKISKILLFDLENDADEMNDLSEDINQRERIISLFEELLVLQKSLEDKLDISSILTKFKNRLI